MGLSRFRFSGVYQELGESSAGCRQSSDNLPEARLSVLLNEFLSGLGAPPWAQSCGKATFDAVPRKQNGLDTSQGGYCSNQS